MHHSIKKLWHFLGPIIMSALTFFCSYLILSSLFSLLFPFHSLLDNRGIGKISFSFMVLYQIALFLFIARPSLWQQCFLSSVYWMKSKSSWMLFFKYLSFGILSHGFLLLLFYTLGNATLFFSHLFALSLLQIIKCVSAIGVTFGLAWSEETIFRGFLYSYCRESFSWFPSMVITSIGFMFAHALTQPWSLISSEWKLGLGLFLLGMVLNILYLQTRSLASSIGFHMGLVTVKVLLRRIPIISILPSTSYLVAADVRQAGITHGAFLIIGILLISSFFYTNQT